MSFLKSLTFNPFILIFLLLSQNYAFVPSKQRRRQQQQHHQHQIIALGQHRQPPLSPIHHDAITKSSLIQTQKQLFQERTILQGAKRDNDSVHIDWNKSDQTTKGILVLLTVPLAWGTYGPVVKFLYEIQPPVPGFVFSACYYIIAAVTMTLLVNKSTTNIDSDNIQLINSSSDADNDTTTTTSMKNLDNTVNFNYIPMLGGIELGGYLFIANCLQIIGLRTVPSDRAGFLVQLTTVMVPFVEALLLSNSTVPLRAWLACIFALFGLVVMNFDGQDIASVSMAFSDPTNNILSSFTGGDVLIIMAAMLYTLHVVRLGFYAKEIEPLKLAANKATVEAILSVLLVLALCSLPSSSSMMSTADGLWKFALDSGNEIQTFVKSFLDGLVTNSIPSSALLSAIGATFWTGWVTCAYTIYAQSYGQKRVSPTNANLIYTFQPIFTALFAYVLLGETMGPFGFVGGAIIGTAVFVSATATTTTTSSENNDNGSILPETVNIASVMQIENNNDNMKNNEMGVKKTQKALK